MLILSKCNCNQNFPIYIYNCIFYFYYVFIYWLQVYNIERSKENRGIEHKPSCKLKRNQRVFFLGEMIK